MSEHEQFEHKQHKQKDRKVTLVEPLTKSYFPDLQELWEFRGLLRSLIWRNFRVRYRNTVVGVAWVVLQPLAIMLVLFQVFGIWAGFAVERIPYPIHALSGLVLLFFVNRVIAGSIGVIRDNQDLTRKVYFPRLLLPSALVASELVDLTVALLLLVVIMLLYRVFPAPTAFLVFGYLLLLVAWAFSLSVCLAALGIRFHDLTLLLPIVTLLLLYLTPIIYPITFVPEKHLILYALNPLTGIVNGFRWALLGAEPFYPWMALITLAQTLVLGLFGLVYFTRTERDFNDFL